MAARYAIWTPDVTQAVEPLRVALPDGRRLAYAEYGDPAGALVMHFHGSGGSRMEWPGDQSILKDIGVRFISMDRPGHGWSDPEPKRTLLDWPRDVEALAKHLCVESFYVEGWSAGGAYALACSYQLPSRVRACAILSGIGPYDRPDPLQGLSPEIAEWMRNAREMPEKVLPFRQRMADVLASRSSAAVGAMLAAGNAEDDRAVAARPDLQILMGTNIKEGYRQGPEGPAQDDVVINSPWGFRLEEIAAPIDVWQGEIDRNVPLTQGETQHRRLPNSTLRVLPNTAHLFPLVRWREILLTLLGPR